MHHNQNETNQKYSDMEDLKLANNSTLNRDKRNMIFFTQSCTKMYSLCEMRNNNYFWYVCDLLLILRSRVNFALWLDFNYSDICYNRRCSIIVSLYEGKKKKIAITVSIKFYWQFTNIIKDFVSDTSLFSLMYLYWGLLEWFVLLWFVILSTITDL